MTILKKKRINITYLLLKNQLKIKTSFGIFFFFLKKKLMLKKINNKILLFIFFKNIFNFINIFDFCYGTSQQFIYYNHLKVYGLGFRISLLSNQRLRLDFGWSHVVFINIPKEINVIKKRSEFIIYSNFETLLRNFIFNLTHMYKRSPYTLKGVFKIHQNIKVKVGKQRQK